MNRESLNKTIDGAKFSYYESIAKLIVDNPTVSLSDLRRLHSITHHEMWKAQEMFHVRRKTGQGSLACRKANTNSFNGSNWSRDKF
jgi:hypothetical protein